MFVQPNNLMPSSGIVRPHLTIPSADEMKSLCAAQHVRPVTMSMHLNVDASCDTLSHRERNLIHTFARPDDSLNNKADAEQTVGAFAGFQFSVR